MNNLEKALIFATILTPFTLLRVGFIGFGEVSILILFVYGLQAGYICSLSKDLLFSRFWISFLIISFFGFAYNIFFLGHKTGTVENMFFDFSAYVMLFVTCIVIENLSKIKEFDCYKILKYVFLILGIVYTVLFGISLTVDSILGLPLKYFNYFAPFVSNLHQAAMVIAPLPFIGLFVFEREKGKLIRLLVVILILILSFLILQTGSFKAYVGLVLGWGTYFLIKFVNLFKGDFRKAVLAISLSIIVFVMLYNIQEVFEKISGVFIEEDISNGRSSLYTNALEIGFSSPVIGLGPGSHIFQDGQFWDSHETFITVFLQSGGIGLILFIILMYKISRHILRVPALLAGFIPILIYALGGDIMRRLPVWLLILLFYYYIHSELQNKAIEE